MLRATSAVFGAIFLPVGVSFFFILHHRHWMRGVGALAASFGFFYVAWRAYDILGLDGVGPAPIAPASGLALRPHDASDDRPNFPKEPLP